jgi:predicted permease
VALSVGLNAVTLSALDSAFFRPLPYRDPGRIVRIYETDDGGRRMQAALLNAQDWRRQSHTLASIAVYSGGPVALADGGQPEYVQAAAVGQEFAQVLGVEPVRGRWIAPEEAKLGAPPVAVIRESLWRRRYGARPDVIGMPLSLHGISATVVGVMPDAVTFPDGAEVWLSAEWSDDTNNRTAHNWSVLGRLRPDASIDAARAELSALTRRLTADLPAGDSFVGRGVDGVSFRRSLQASEGSLLFLLQAASLLVLAITCVNLTNLLLVRGARQRTEMALRSALGAGRGHLVRRVVVEAMVLTTVAGGIGLLIAAPFRNAATLLLRRFLPRLPELTLDLRVIAATLVGSALVGALAAAVPALRAAGEDPNNALGGAGGTRVTRQHPIMGILIALEIGLALTLAAGAGLLARSLFRLALVPAGFDPTGRVVVQIPGTVAAPSDTTPLEAAVTRIDRIVVAAGRVPGVRRAAMAISVPMMGGGSNATIQIEGLEFPSNSTPSADFRVVGPDYFRTLGITLERGRDLSMDDRPTGPRVAVVNATFAREYLAGRDPLGIRVRFAGMQLAPEPWATIVGVIQDVRHHGLDAEPAPEVYLSYRQRALQGRDFSIVVEADGPTAPIGALETMLRSEAPTAPFKSVPLASVVREELAVPRVRSVVLGLFALLAVGLAGAGIFGVVAFTVAQRTREIGLRLALGSARGAATWAAMRLVLRPVVVGLGLGLAGTLAGTGLVRAFLFETGARDPLVLAAAVAVLAGVSLVASYLPARRAARIDPAVALRES